MAKSSRSRSSLKSSVRKPDLNDFTNMATSKAVNNMKQYLAFFTVVIVVLSLFSIIINFLALLWIQKLDNIPDCTCSEDWKRKYIKYFLYAYFIILTISIFMNVYLLISNETMESLKSSYMYHIYNAITFIFGIFGVFNLFVSIYYINDLKNTHCECSEDIRREIYYYYNIIRLCLMILFIILTLIAMLALR